MFDFLKRDGVDTEEEYSNDAEVKELLDALEYTNSYLAQIGITLGELLKQRTIANALHILDSEYNNADSVMSVDEILAKKEALLGEIFIDYRVKQESDDNND